MIIRKFKKSDEIKVKRMIFSVLKEIYKKTKVKWENFEDYLIFYVVEDKGKIIGTVALKEINGKWIKLKRMYVKKGFREKDIGKKLLKKVIKFAKKRGFKKMILTSYSEMKDAIIFYKKSGFKVVKNPKNKFFTYPKLKEYNKKQVAMEKKI